MAADASQIGLLSLTFVGAQGATVEFLERIGDRLVRLGTSAAAPDQIVTELKDATTWSCERPERRFVATATLPSGALALATYSVRTPSCRSRFTLSAPRRASPGASVRVRIVDRWGIGSIKPALCVTPPRRPRACHTVALGDAVTVAARSIRAAARGDWRVQLLVRGRCVASTVVRIGGSRGAAPRVPTVLATGDSTMQGIDGFLADELGETASVVSDVRIGTGISRVAQESLPGAGDATAAQWAQLAAQQTRRLRQRATVISLGANEGFPMTTPDGPRVLCCDAAWAAEYSRRARLTMQAYPHAGAARVLWLTLPLPRSDARRAITSAVNGAIVAAAAGVAGVRVLRMDLVFTPDGYREVMRYRGRDVDVRDVDGVHLNVAGTAIAAKIVAKALRER
jgi:lysophospholipase L1-like esterase